MSDWRAKPGFGSFREARFVVDNDDEGGGRAIVVHKYPLSGKPPDTQDLGSEGSTFSVECFVLGDDYLEAREKLLKALQAPGPGELVHPIYGNRKVVVPRFRVRNERDEGGVARFSFDCIETSSGPALPASTIDGAAALKANAAVAEATIGDQFLAAYNKLTTLRDSVSGSLRAMSNAMNRVSNRVQQEVQANARLRRDLAALTTDARALVNAPESLLSSIAGLVHGLADGLVFDANIVDPSSAMLSLYNTDLGVRPPAPTPSREIERANFDATQFLFQRLVLVQAAVIAVDQTFVSYDDAVRVRSRIAALLDEHLEAVTDDTYADLIQVRADLTRAVPGEANSLPKLQKYTPPAATPSLVLVHELYGNVALEQDLLDRNKIVDPMTIVGGRELEILGVVS